MVNLITETAVILEPNCLGKVNFCFLICSVEIIVPTFWCFND